MNPYMEDTSYEKARVAVDAVMLTVMDKALTVYLRRREKEPQNGMMELPGGLLRPDETADDTLRRKVIEVLGMQASHFWQFAAFTDPGRDTRERTISIGYLALVRASDITDPSPWIRTDAATELAFDHAAILRTARQHLRRNLGPATVRHLLPSSFPLNQLQEIFEIIEGRRYDNRNFRKRMIASGIVTETGGMEQGVSHRPAKLFRFTST